MLPMPHQPPRHFVILSTRTHHASRKEISWFDIIERNVAGHLTYCVPDRKYSVDLIELVAPKAKLLSHSRDVSIVQVTTIWVVKS
jgi:hypothetical protein